MYIRSGLPRYGFHAARYARKLIHANCVTNLIYVS